MTEADIFDHLDPSGLGRPRDPKLRELALALDAERMAARFTDYFRARGMPKGSSVSRCAIEKVYYKPTRHCGICYRLTLVTPSGGEIDEWVYGRMFGLGLGIDRFERATEAAAELGAGGGLAGVPKVTFWDEMNMMVAVFPFDRKMPHLGRAADPDYLKGQVEAGREALGFLAGSRCTGLATRRVKYMPGKRCVLHCRAQVAENGGPQREFRFFSKTYHDARSRLHFSLLRSACEQLRAQRSAFDLPEPLLHLDRVNTVWVADWGGTPLMAALGRDDWETLAGQAGRAVASLHRGRIEGLEPGPDLGETLGVAAQDLARYAAGFPAHQGLAMSLRERLEALRGTLASTPAPLAPIHGACRAEQMLTREGQVTLIDFDALSLADPLEDVAEWIASLEFLGIARGAPRAGLERSGRRFLEAYADHVPWPCDDRRIGWYVLAYLASKMYSVLKHLDPGALSRLPSAGETLARRWLDVVG